MNYSLKDKIIESTRYDKRAEKILLSNNSLNSDVSIPLFNRKPSEKYQYYLKKYINKSSIVLELGAGTGRFSEVLMSLGGKVCITDISPASLEVIKKKYSKYHDNFNIQVADIEKLPYDNNSFDIVSGAAVLSYGDNLSVMNEINRVLKPNGVFICIDSLNENPFYKLNRWINHKRGKRTFSTLINMPTLKLIEEYRSLFDVLGLRFYGSIVWLYPLFKTFIGERYATQVIEKFDILIKTYRSSFKFVGAFRKK